MSDLRFTDFDTANAEAPEETTKETIARLWKAYERASGGEYRAGYALGIIAVIMKAKYEAGHE